MKELSMKEILVLAYRGVEAIDRDNAETKETINRYYAEIVAKEQAEAEAKKTDAPEKAKKPVSKK